MAERENNFVSFKNRLHDFGIKSGSFTNDAGENIQYKQIVAVVQFEGEPEEIVLSGNSAPRPKAFGAMLRGADKVKLSGNMLDDNDEE